MKFKQLEYAICVGKNKSFSKAAEELYVSQPNISSTINILEDELGLKIFDRTNQGVEITSKGAIFLEHANNIMDELEKIPSILESETYHDFTIGSMFNHTVVTKAFIRLCKEFEDAENLSFSVYSDSSKEIIQKIYMNETDLGILLINPIILDNYRNTIGKKNIEFKVLESLNMNVNLRNNHPLLQSRKFSFKRLYDYPFVNYNFSMLSDFSIISDFPDIVSKGFINEKKMISVNERDTRRQILLSTDSYTIGATFHPDMKQIDRIVSIPIPDVESLLVLVYRKDMNKTVETDIFLKLLMRELSKVLSIS